jgi:hypothetical protein
MALLGGIETADYYNFKMLCAYVNQARNYLLLLRKELGEVPNVSYAPINWFSKVTLNLYAIDPAKNGSDPILSNMKNISDYPGFRAFNTNWFGEGMFSVRTYSNDKVCDTRKGKGQGKKKGQGQGNDTQQGGDFLKLLFNAVRVVETVGLVIDVVAFQKIDQIFNAYRWYLLEYLRLCGIQSNPCVRHDYILTTKLRSTGKFFRGKGIFSKLEDPIIMALRKARPSFPPYSFYLKEVDTMGKKKQGGTRRQKPRARTTRRKLF